MSEQVNKDTLRWADYLRRGCNENACYGLPIENRCDECLFYNAAADEIERLRELEAKWKPIVSRAVGIFNQQEQHRDFVPSIWAQRVAEYIVNGGDRA